MAPQLPFAILASGLPGPCKPALVTCGIYMLFTNTSLGTGAKFIWEGKKRKSQMLRVSISVLAGSCSCTAIQTGQGVPVRCGSLSLQRDLKKSLNKGGNVTNSHWAACCHTMARQASA